MADPIDPKNVDKRTWERYAKSGQLDEKAYEKYVKGLPDLQADALPVETSMADDIDDDLDDEGDDDAEA